MNQSRKRHSNRLSRQTLKARIVQGNIQYHRFHHMNHKQKQLYLKTMRDSTRKTLDHYLAKWTTNTLRNANTSDIHTIVDAQYRLTMLQKYHEVYVVLKHIKETSSSGIPVKDVDIHFLPPKPDQRSIVFRFWLDNAREPFRYYFDGIHTNDENLISATLDRANDVLSLVDKQALYISTPTTIMKN